MAAISLVKHLIIIIITEFVQSIHMQNTRTAKNTNRYNNFFKEKKNAWPVHKQSQQYNPTHAQSVTASTFDSNRLKEIHKQC